MSKSKNRVFRVLALVASVVLVSCAAAPLETFNSTGFAALVNAERTPRGLSPLSVSEKLNAAALAHAEDMAVSRRFSHTSRTGTTPSDRAHAQGYQYCFIAENIAMGYPDQQQALAAWMQSASHRKNILTRSATQFGIARADGNYWVMVLGRPC